MNRPFAFPLMLAALCLSVSPIARAEAPAVGNAQAASPAAAGAQPKLGLKLDMKPLPSREEARRYAASWLQAAGIADGVRPGRLRALGGIYVADLMDRGGGKQLVNQLVMRKKDGYAVLIYPANLAATVPVAPGEGAATPALERREVMMGMAGLAAMSGRSGINGGSAAPGAPAGRSFLINSPQEATTAAKLWLFRNGLHALTVAAVRNEGGIFVGRLVDKQSRATHNQFILRRADGFIVMANPVVLPQVASASAVHSFGHAK